MTAFDPDSGTKLTAIQYQIRIQYEPTFDSHSRPIAGGSNVDFIRCLFAEFSTSMIRCEMIDCRAWRSVRIAVDADVKKSKKEN